jgi:hypothetical protein
VGRTWPEAAFDSREVEWRSRVMARITSPRQCARQGFGRRPAKSRRTAKQISADQAGRTSLNRPELVKIDSTRSTLLPP